MAISVFIRKASENDQVAVYMFGPDEDRLFGRLVIDKHKGHIVVGDPYPGDKVGFYSSRASKRLKQHFDKGEFPDQTMYAA